MNKTDWKYRQITDPWLELQPSDKLMKITLVITPIRKTCSNSVRSHKWSTCWSDSTGCVFNSLICDKYPNCPVKSVDEDKTICGQPTTPYYPIYSTPAPPARVFNWKPILIVIGGVLALALIFFIMNGRFIVNLCLAIGEGCQSSSNERENQEVPLNRRQRRFSREEGEDERDEGAHGEVDGEGDGRIEEWTGVGRYGHTDNRSDAAPSAPFMEGNSDRNNGREACQETGKGLLPPSYEDAIKDTW